MRFRLFAGPNGSGKSTLYLVIPSYLLTNYINADDIEKQLREYGSLVLPFTTEGSQSLSVFAANQRGGFGSIKDEDFISEGTLIKWLVSDINSYQAATISDWLRQQCLENGISFCSETVLSHSSKADFMAATKEKGFRNYLYYVCTSDPEINVQRVAGRVADGGHNVDRDKIIDRYYRSLKVARLALPHCYRAYFFDNSLTEPTLIAEISPEGDLNLFGNNETMPTWLIQILS